MPEPHQDRAVNEYYELAEKNEKLGAFITSAPFLTLDAVERNCLVEQQAAMNNYKFWLKARIQFWGIELTK